MAKEKAILDAAKILEMDYNTSLAINGTHSNRVEVMQQ